MKKKSIVLLITLLFIGAISVLILQNLKDSDTFFTIVNNDVKLKQTQITINNVNEEIFSLFSNKKDKLDEILESYSESIPFIYGNVILGIEISEYQSNNLYNLNDINISKNTLNDTLFNESISDRFTFFDIINTKKKQFITISSNKQIDTIIDEYIDITDDDRILNINNMFTYINFDKNESTRYIQTKYNINVDSFKTSVDMVFKVGDKKSISLDVIVKK